MVLICHIRPDQINRHYQSISSKNYRILFSKCIFSGIGHILRHKTSLNKFKKVELISSTVFYHNGMKLGIKYIKKTGKNKYVETKEHDTKQPMD